MKNRKEPPLTRDASQVNQKPITKAPKKKNKRNVAKRIVFWWFVSGVILFSLDFLGLVDLRNSNEMSQKFTNEEKADLRCISVLSEARDYYFEVKNTDQYIEYTDLQNKILVKYPASYFHSNDIAADKTEFLLNIANYGRIWSDNFINERCR